MSNSNNNDKKTSQNLEDLKNQNITNSVDEKELEKNDDDIKSKNSIEADKISEEKTEEINMEEISKSFEEYLKNLEKQIATKEQEIKTWQIKTARLSEELQKYDKHKELYATEMAKKAKKDLLKNLHPFLNTLYLAFNFLPNTDDENITKFFKTLKISFDTLINDIQKQQIEIIVPKIGDFVDPTTMNIINDISNNQNQEITVKQVVSIGIKVDNQVIIPVSIMV